VALDSEHRLVLAVVCGKRTRANLHQLVQEARRRTGCRTPRLITSDEYKVYREAILTAYGRALPRERPYRPGRPRRTRWEPPEDLVYATVHKTRHNGRVVKVEPRRQFGTEAMLARALSASSASRAVNTSFIERHNATDRHRNSRKVRKSYRFSKDRQVHEAATYLTIYTYNFCWPVRTLRVEVASGSYEPRTPAMVAGLTDHVWTLQQWLTYPARIR
jgi:IS1 family transposase